MTHRIFCLLFLFLLLPTIARADYQEKRITLDRQDNEAQTISLGYANVTVQLVTAYAQEASIRVSMENLTMDEVLFLFKNGQSESQLKKLKPKFEFSKTYGGDKGKRSVQGCKYLGESQVKVIPAESKDLFTFHASTSGPIEVTIPIYRVVYDPKKFLKSSKYTILREDLLVLKIDVVVWSEQDPDYVALKQRVNNFKSRLDFVTFCPNNAHKPSLAQQQAPYKATQDSLITAIYQVLEANRSWMSQDLPHQRYTQLLNSVKDIDLNKYNHDCGNHKVIKQHHCNYCSLSADQIYQRLDNTYQSLHTGRITKDAAVSTAKALYTCYQKNNKRKKNAGYSGKIPEYYNRIINY
ncbi:MAG: hypothetical protein LUC85_03985 [Bacteroidales bacterium]|nr:hypothetical protein [Bacteroidales bacterium]MCD8393980.1 hypothetical protein [Bacteroidales bacterium]